MNETNLPLVEPIAPPAYKDRSTGLMVFGILTLLLGGLCGLLVPLMMFGHAMAAKAPNAPPTNSGGLLWVGAIYGGLAVMLIWLGIGSMMKRRWARALLLICSWSWLIMGIFITASMPFFMGKVFANMSPDPQTGQPTMPPAANTFMIVFMVIFLGIFFILVPAVWVFFYNSRHVKATCEARDPVTRWTDACPLPVLGYCLWTWLAVPMMLLLPLTSHTVVMPSFGMFAVGLPAVLLCVVSAAIWGVAGWRIYRLDARGWWLILVASLLFMLSSLLTYTHHDIIELYQLQGLPPAQIDQIKKMSFLTGNHMSWFTVLCTLPFLGYLLFIKKYLRKG